MDRTKPYSEHPFVMALQRGRKDRDLSNATLAAAVRQVAGRKGIAGSTLSRWLTGESLVPKAAVAVLCKECGLAERTPEAVEAKYGLYWSGGYHTAIREIEAQMALARRAVEVASRHSSGLFAGMGPDHFFVSTSTTVMPLVFDPENHPDFFRDRVAAIRRGAISLMVVPNAKRLATLESFGYERLPNFLDNFDSYLTRVVAELKGSGVKDPKGHAARHVGLIEYDEFPHTPGDVTVSLFGHRRKVGERAELRIITRGVLGIRRRSSTPAALPGTNTGATTPPVRDAGVREQG